MTTTTATFPDFTLPIIPGVSDFNCGTSRVVPVSDRAKQVFAEKFGAGCVSVDLPKTRVCDFIAFAERNGMTVA